MGGLSKLQNLSITLQRRWSNVLSDAQRQHIVELFLGLRLATYLPSAEPLYTATPALDVRILFHMLLSCSCGCPPTCRWRSHCTRPPRRWL